VQAELVAILDGVEIRVAEEGAGEETDPGAGMRATHGQVAMEGRETLGGPEALVH
jgi:hypothetical protein